MTKAKTKTIRMPGKERPAATRLVIQNLPRRSLTIGIWVEARNPPSTNPIRPVAEGLDYRFLRSQPRVIGSGSLRKARPRRSEYNLNTHPEALNKSHHVNHSTCTLQTHGAAR